MITITIKYNNPIGNFKAIEETETIYCDSVFSEYGTNILYAKSGYNVKAISKSEIVSISGLTAKALPYEKIKEELKKRRENTRYFTKKFYNTFLDCMTLSLNFDATGETEKYKYKIPEENFYRFRYFDPVYKSDFYNKNSGCYCEFLSIYH